MSDRLMYNRPVRYREGWVRFPSTVLLEGSPDEAVERWDRHPERWFVLSSTGRLLTVNVIEEGQWMHAEKILDRGIRLYVKHGMGLAMLEDVAAAGGLTFRDSDRQRFVDPDEFHRLVAGDDA